MKYIIFSLILHLSLGIGMHFVKEINQEEPETIINMSVSFNVITSEENTVIAMSEDNQENKINEAPTPPPPPPVGEIPPEPPKDEVVPERIPEVKRPEPEPKPVVEKPKEEPPKPPVREQPKVVRENTNTKSEVTKEDSTAKDTGVNVFGDNNNFRLNGDGSYTALSAEGINYKLISSPQPAYPARAERSGYRGEVSVRARITVGLRGTVENVQIISGNSGMGFDDEVRRVLRSWRFEPIYYQNRNIKMQFTRTFHFKSRR